MAESLPAPYKGHYTLTEYWPMLTKSSFWKSYKAAHKDEALALEADVRHKISGEYHTTPKDLTHTYFGNAILMVILTMTP